MVFSRKRRRSTMKGRSLFSARRRFTRRSGTFKRKRTFKRKTFKRKRIPKVNSIRNTFFSTDTQDDYNLIITDKRDAMTRLVQTAFATSLTFSAMIKANTQLQSFEKCFRNARVVSLKLTLTPMVSSVVAFSDVNAKVTKIHWVNDDGSVINYVRSGNLTIPQAKSFGKVYHEAVFDKPFTFHIKLYQKAALNSTVSPTDKYRSASQWRMTPFAPGLGTDNLYTDTIPDGNLHYGFTDYTTDFQYKTKYEVVCDYKNPVDQDLFIP